MQDPGASIKHVWEYAAVGVKPAGDHSTVPSTESVLEDCSVLVKVFPFFFDGEVDHQVSVCEWANLVDREARHQRWHDNICPFASRYGVREYSRLGGERVELWKSEALKSLSINLLVRELIEDYPNDARVGGLERLG